jgi:HAD superfamily hydrolase (TIGR01509 family)
MCELMNHRSQSTVLRAGIFDMDGVLLDSEPLHHEAVNELLSEDGKPPLPFEEYVPYMGTTDEYTWKDLIDRFSLPHPFSYYRDRYDAVILEHYRRSSRPAPGVHSLLDSLRARGLPLAIASSSRSLWVETCLAALDIRGYFDIVVTGDMVERSKPDPEIYLLAAKRLNVAPSQCFVVEDSPNGIAAAVAAGMFTVAVETPYTRGQQTRAAQAHLNSLTEFDCSILNAGPARIH